MRELRLVKELPEVSATNKEDPSS